MVHLLGYFLPDTHRARFALTTIYGIGHQKSHKLCSRLQIHPKAKMKDLTPFQTTALAAFLNSPKTTPSVPYYPTAAPGFKPPPPTASPTNLRFDYLSEKAERVEMRKEWEDRAGPLYKQRKEWKDDLVELKIESELRMEMRDNILHQKNIGSYVGKRHALGFPVRGQTTQNNARTAKKLNKIERKN